MLECNCPKCGFLEIPSLFPEGDRKEWICGSFTSETRGLVQSDKCKDTQIVNLEKEVLRFKEQVKDHETICGNTGDGF